MSSSTMASPTAAPSAIGDSVLITMNSTTNTAQDSSASEEDSHSSMATTNGSTLFQQQESTVDSNNNHHQERSDSETENGHLEIDLGGKQPLITKIQNDNPRDDETMDEKIIDDHDEDSASKANISHNSHTTMYCSCIHTHSHDDEARPDDNTSSISQTSTTTNDQNCSCGLCGKPKRRRLLSTTTATTIDEQHKHSTTATDAESSTISIQNDNLNETSTMIISTTNTTITTSRSSSTTTPASTIIINNKDGDDVNCSGTNVVDNKKINVDDNDDHQRLRQPNIDNGNNTFDSNGRTSTSSSLPLSSSSSKRPTLPQTTTATTTTTIITSINNSNSTNSSSSSNINNNCTENINGNHSSKTTTSTSTSPVTTHPLQTTTSSTSSSSSSTSKIVLNLNRNNSSSSSLSSTPSTPPITQQQSTIIVKNPKASLNQQTKNRQQQPLLLNIKREPESPPPSISASSGGNNSNNNTATNQQHAHQQQQPYIVTNNPTSSPSPTSTSATNLANSKSQRSCSANAIITPSGGGPLSSATNTPSSINNNNNNNSTNNNNMMDYHATAAAPPQPPPSLHGGGPNGPAGHGHHGHGHQMNAGAGPHQMTTTPPSAGTPSPQTMLPPQMTTGGHHGSHGHQQPTISVAAVVTAASSSPNSDPKDCIEELCPVCGDRVSGYHYGLLTCESCKGFFKRTVQNKKVYTCVADRNCHIDKSQRKRCPYCRFQKCLDVGMKLEAVRADRMRGGRNKFGPMYKRDRARRLQLLRQKQLAKAHHVVGVGGTGHGAGVGPPSATLLPSAAANEAINFLNTAPGSHAGSLFDGVKPELIQIPQLSSSTSSPDSSPSPGSTAGAVAAAAAAAAAAASGQLPGAVAAVAAAASAGHHFNMSPLVPNNLQTSNPLTSGGNLPSLVNNPTAGDHVLKWGSNGPGPSNMAGGSSKSSLAAHYEQQANKMVMPPLIRELQMSMPDDKEWQSQLFGLLQNQTYNQCEVDLFELMCKVIDQSLFAQVDWARNSIFFKDLKVDDQMKLLQHAWSDMLVLDHIHQRLHAGLPDETTLPNGQKFNLLSLALLGVPQVADQLHQVTARLQDLKVDTNDYICLKFLLLLNPEVRGLTNFKLVHDAHEQTKQALLDYCLNFYPQITDKFNQLLSLVPEIHALTLRGEDFLYYKHINGSAPTQTLLMEMLHAKKK